MDPIKAVTRPSISIRSALGNVLRVHDTMIHASLVFQLAKGFVASYRVGILLNNDMVGVFVLKAQAREGERDETRRRLRETGNRKS